MNNLTRVCFAVACVLLLALVPPVARAAVELARFEGRWQADRVILEWETGSEINHAGFNLYRYTEDLPPSQVTAQATRLNDAIVFKDTACTPAGNVYVFEDTTADPSQAQYHYWLESINCTGGSEIGSDAHVVVAGQAEPTPTPTSVPSATATSVPTEVPTATATTTATISPTPSATETLQPTTASGPTTTPSVTPTASLMPTASPTPRNTATPRPTFTPWPTRTPRPAATATSMPSPTLPDSQLPAVIQSPTVSTSAGFGATPSPSPASTVAAGTALTPAFAPTAQTATTPAQTGQPPMVSGPVSTSPPATETEAAANTMLSGNPTQTPLAPGVSLQAGGLSTTPEALQRDTPTDPRAGSSGRVSLLIGMVFALAILLIAGWLYTSARQGGVQ